MSQRVITFGQDKIGRATMIIRPRFHTPGEYPLEQMINYGIFVVERTIRQTEKYGHHQFVAIMDRAGVTKAN
jgi:CRAL/TRIO domain